MSGSGAPGTSGGGSRRDVIVVRWPDDTAQVIRLAATHTPRLLLVAEAADPPDSGDCEEDWIRLPADDRDVAARLRALERRVARHDVLPELDEHGRVRHHGRWVSPSPIERRLSAPLVEHFGAVVSTDALLLAGWPDGAGNPVALRVHMTKLRRHLEPLGLDIRSVRETGYVLEEHTTGRTA